jgi:hypothetical protein
MDLTNEQDRRRYERLMNGRWPHRHAFGTLTSVVVPGRVSRKHTRDRVRRWAKRVLKRLDEIGLWSG